MVVRYVESNSSEPGDWLVRALKAPHESSPLTLTLTPIRLIEQPRAAPNVGGCRREEPRRHETSSVETTMQRMRECVGQVEEDVLGGAGDGCGGGTQGQGVTRAARKGVSRTRL